MSKYMRSSAIELKQSYYDCLNKAIKVLVSISVFSIILSFPSLLPSLVKYFHIYFSSNIFPLELVSYMFDKNYMFLVCNGLLLFIVKNSGLFENSPPGIGLNYYSHEHDFMINGNNVGKIKALYADKEQVENNKIHKEQGRETDEHLIAEKEEEEEEEEILVLEADGIEEGGSELVIIIEDDEINGEQGIELLSTEELNKKCDEFIKRMKGEIKFEA